MGQEPLLYVLVYVQYGYWIYSIAQVVLHVCDIQMIDRDQYSEARRMIRPLESAGPAECRSAPNDFF